MGSMVPIALTIKVYRFYCIIIMGHVYIATVANGIQTFNTGELTITVIVIVYNKKGKFQKCMIILYCLTLNLIPFVNINH